MTARSSLLCLALLALLGRGAEAAFDDLGAGARAPGMGNAFTALADDVQSIHYNPAGLSHLERPQLSMTYARFYMGLSDGSNLGTSQFAYAQPLKSGRWGVVGGAWERFALDSMYTEQSLYSSWGKRILRRENGSQLLAGISLKYLMRSFKPGPEAYNAKSELQSTNLPDPVLTGARSNGVPDADLGFIYKLRKRVQFGLMFQHAMEPDVGFSSTDKLKRNIRLGAAYRSMWMNLTGELRNDAAPNGSTDRDLIIAAERVFPTLEHGQFGFRGSLGVGSRDWKQLTTGLSYRINKIQVDYAFLMPIGTVKGTAGTHRFGMTFHFGAPSPEEEITQDLLLQAERMREGKGPSYGYEHDDALRPKTLDDPELAKVRMLIEARQYRQAYRTLVELALDLPPDEGLIRLSNRLSLASYYYPEIPEPKEKWETALVSGVRSFLYSRDHDSMLFTAYAFSMRPTNTQLDKFLEQLEKAVGLKAERLPLAHPRGFIEELLFRVEVAYNRRENEKVIALLEDILMLEPLNTTALERVGSSYFILERYSKALEAWKKALPLEKDPREKMSLEMYIGQARAKLALPGTKEPPPPEPALQPPGRFGKRAAAVPARSKELDPAIIQRLYQKGVEHYARGENLLATSMFMRILQLDPSNAQAKKALDRLKERR